MIGLEEMIFKAFSSLIVSVIPWQSTRLPRGVHRPLLGLRVELGQFSSWDWRVAGLNLALCEFGGLCCRLGLPGLS